MKKTVMVIDDEQSICRAYTRLIEKAGYPAVCAPSGEEALRLFEPGAFGLIFLDLKMEGMSGVDILRAIRRRDTEVNVYVCTGFLDKYFDELKKARDEGLEFEILQKPVGADELKSVVIGCLKPDTEPR